MSSLAFFAVLASHPFIARAQQFKAIGHTSAKEVQVSGAVQVSNGEMQLGNGSAITAGTQSVTIALSRGGQLRLCQTTAVHLSRDSSINTQGDSADATGLMIALDRGAIEANYQTAKYSDVLLTPDLRILISGPGQADVKVRVNRRGDTCIDNHGADAPYITVTSQMDGGLYRILPNQHVTLLHGDLHDVLDTETEPCGCPAPPVSVADSGVTSKNPAAPGQHAGGPSSAPADTAFPIAQSEGLAPAPSLPSEPVVKPGDVHEEVTVPFVYKDGTGAAGTTTNPDGASSGTDGNALSAGSTANVLAPAVSTNNAPATSSLPGVSTAQAIAEAPPAAPPPASPPPGSPLPAPAGQAPKQPGIFHRIGHFFAHLFGS